MSWEEGISGRIMEYFHFFYVILCCLIVQHSENWKKAKSEEKRNNHTHTHTHKPQQQPLLWKVTAEIGGMEFLSLDNKTTNSGINHYYKKTVEAKFWPFFTLFYLPKQLAKML